MGMKPRHVRVLLAAIATGCALAGVYYLATFVWQETQYEETRGRLTRPAESSMVYRGMLRSRYLEWHVSYEFTASGDRFTGHGSTDFAPEADGLSIYYRRSDPRISTPEPPSNGFLKSLMLLAGALLLWPWERSPLSTVSAAARKER